MGKIDMEDIQAPDMPLEKQKWEAHDIEYPDKVLDLEPIKKELVEMRHDFFDKVQELNQAVSKIYSDMYAMRPKEANIDEIVSKVLQKVATNSYSSVHAPVDEETIIAKVLARVPKSVGGATYEVAPLEKLKRAFMEEAKQKVLVDVSKLDDEQKKMLKYIEVQGSGQKLGTIIEKCLFKLQTSGGTRDSIGKKLKDMAALELIRYDSTHGLYYPALKDMIAKYCGQHGATPQEIDQVYSHIVMEMLK
jgi:hypothetical protein